MSNNRKLQGAPGKLLLITMPVSFELMQAALEADGRSWSRHVPDRRTLDDGAYEWTQELARGKTVRAVFRRAEPGTVSAEIRWSGPWLRGGRSAEAHVIDTLTRAIQPEVAAGVEQEEPALDVSVLTEHDLPALIQGDPENGTAPRRLEGELLAKLIALTADTYQTVGTAVTADLPVPAERFRSGDGPDKICVHHIWDRDEHGHVVGEPRTYVIQTSFRSGSPTARIFRDFEDGRVVDFGHLGNREIRGLRRQFTCYQFIKDFERREARAEVAAKVQDQWNVTEAVPIAPAPAVAQPAKQPPRPAPAQTTVSWTLH